jgi:nucleotide-binding universal stress UspA family protein
MNETIQKMIVIPLDGSDNALKPLSYLDLVFGPKHILKVTLLYVLPRLPNLLVEESRMNNETLQQLENLKARNVEIAERLLAVGQKKLVAMGFAEKSIEAVSKKIEVGIARDIVNWSEKKGSDAVIISTRGRSKLAAFFLGETANKVLEYSRRCPVWMIKGTVREKHAVIAVDNSKNAMRAVAHAGFMLSGTDVNVTVFHSKRDLKRSLSKELADEFPELQKFCQRKAGKVMLPFIQNAKNILLDAGLRERQITTKMIDPSRGAALDILDEMKSSKAGSLFIGRHGYSNVRDFAMGSVTRKVLNHSEDKAVCIVP